MSLPIEQSSERSQHQSQQAQLCRKKQGEILHKIKTHVKILQEKIYSFGMSSSECQQILQNSIGKILNKNKAVKYRTTAEFIKAINLYVNKKPNRAMKLLMEIINTIDEQVTELQSSESEAEKLGTGLKLEERRSEEMEGQTEGKIQFKRVTSSSVNGNCGAEAALYVKLQTVSDEFLDPQAESSNPSKRRKGRPSGRGRKKY